VIVKVTVFQDSLLLFDVFSQEYGLLKLKAKRTKKKKMLDIGYSIIFEVSVKKENDIHEIQSVKISREFEYIQKDYSYIMAYLDIIWTVLSIQRNVQIEEIYHILHALNLPNIERIYILLAHVKILSIIGIRLQPWDEKISKIFTFVTQNTFSKIQKLTGFTQEIEEQIAYSIENEKKKNPRLHVL